MRHSTLTLLGLAALVAAPAMAADPAAVARGQVVFEHWCVPCHGDGAYRHAGTMALGVKYHGSEPAELSKRTDLTPEIVDYFIRNGVTIMPPFRKTEIDPAAEQDLIAYLTRNSK